MACSTFGTPGPGRCFLSARLAVSPAKEKGRRLVGLRVPRALAGFGAGGVARRHLRGDR